jgi:hypothetical protein
MSSGLGEAGWPAVWLALVGTKAAVDLIRDSPSQRPDRLGLGITRGQASLQVGAAWAIQAQLGDGDAMQRGLQLPVAAPIQPVAFPVA